MGLGWYADWEREKEEREEELWDERKQIIEENKKNDVAILKTKEQYKYYEEESGQLCLFPPLKVTKTKSSQKQNNGNKQNDNHKSQQIEDLENE